MSTSNEGCRVSAGHLLYPGEASSGRTRLYSPELLAKGVPWKSPNTDAETKGCSLKTGNRATLPKTTPTQLIEHGEAKLCPCGVLTPVF